MEWVQKKLTELKSNFSEKIKKEYSPTSFTLNENLKSVLNSPISFTLDEYKQMVESTSNYGDLRMIAGRAMKDGITVKLPSVDDQIAEFGNFLKYCEKTVNGDLGEGVEMRKLYLSELANISEHCDDPQSIAVYPTEPDKATYESVGNEITRGLNEGAEQQPDLGEQTQQSFFHELGANAEQIFAHRMANMAVKKYEESKEENTQVEE